MSDFDQQSLNRHYRFCFSLTNNEAKAYDLLQSALEKYLSSQPSKVTTPEAYLRRIIHNLFIDQYRREQRLTWEEFNEETVTAIDATTESLENITIQQDLLEKMWSLIDPLEREILYLWAVEGHTTQAVAELLETKKGTIVSRIHRLKAKIKRQFDVDIESATS